MSRIIERGHACAQPHMETNRKLLRGEWHPLPSQKFRPYLGVLPEGQSLFWRGGALTRFHPNRRASMDHKPGPSIARAAVMVPTNSHSDLSPGTVRIFHVSTTVTKLPTTGVQSPSISKMPDPNRIAEIMVVRSGGSTHSSKPAGTINTEPTTKRRSSNPVPGQPPANVEYKRRNTNPLAQVRVSHCEHSSIPQKESWSSLFRVWEAGEWWWCSLKLHGRFGRKRPVAKPALRRTEPPSSAPRYSFGDSALHEGNRYLGVGK
jgi:hypothetical protein